MIHRLTQNSGLDDSDHTCSINFVLNSYAEVCNTAELL